MGRNTLKQASWFAFQGVLVPFFLATQFFQVAHKLPQWSAIPIGGIAAMALMFNLQSTENNAYKIFPD